MRFAGALVRGRRGVPLKLRPGLPTHELHEVAFVTARVEPRVRVAVAQNVRMQSLDPGLAAAPLDHLRDTRRAHRTEPRDPEVGQRAEPVLVASHAEIAVEGLGSLRAERTGTRTPAFPSTRTTLS